MTYNSTYIVCCPVAQVFYEKFGYVPTVEQLKDIFKIPAKKDSAEYKKKTEMLLWYMDSFLAAAAGPESWGLLICPYYLPHEKKVELYGKF